MDGNFTWLMRPDGTNPHAPANWSANFSHVCCAAWSPNGLHAVLTVHKLDGTSRLVFTTIDPMSGAMGEIREFDAPGGGEEYGRWSPDGQSTVYEAFTDGSWDLWTVDADARAPRRLTDLPSNERSAAWQTTPLFIYFVKDYREVWRIPMTAAATPSGPPTPWLVLPRLRIGLDSLDVTPDGARLVVAIVKPESDIWLVQRK